MSDTIMPEVPFMPDRFAEQQFELCRTHSERIMEVGTKLEIGLKTIADHLTKLNGSVAAHEQRLSEVERQCVSYDALLELPKEVQNMRLTLTDLTSSRKAILGTVRELISILALIVAGFSAWYGRPPADQHPRPVETHGQVSPYSK